MVSSIRTDWVDTPAFLDAPRAVIGRAFGAEGGVVCLGIAERVTSWLVGPGGRSLAAGPLPCLGQLSEGSYHEPRPACSQMFFCCSAFLSWLCSHAHTLGAMCRTILSGPSAKCYSQGWRGLYPRAPEGSWWFNSNYAGEFLVVVVTWLYVSWGFCRRWALPRKVRSHAVRLTQGAKQQ